MGTSITSEPLRIEVVTDTYVPDINGVSLSLGKLCGGLRVLGHQVEIIRSGRAHGPDESTVFSWPLPGYWEIKVGAPWPGQLLRRWQKDRPDVVYVAIETPLGFSATAAARRLGIPVIGGFHTNFSEYLDQYGVPWLGKLVGLYQKWFHERLNQTVVPSPDALAKLHHAGFSKVTVLGRGVDTQLFNPSRKNPDFAARYGISPGARIVLIVGRISAEKNIGLAIRTFREMRKHSSELACIVVGDGPVRQRLQRENPDVIFPGYLTGEALAACYASCDILLFPSETETFGNVLLEGMASGLAILAYDYAAAAWHGVDSENLIKVPKGNAPEFISAALRLLDEDFRTVLGQGARTTAESLGWPIVVGELEAIFRRVIANQSP